MATYPYYNPYTPGANQPVYVQPPVYQPTYPQAQPQPTVQPVNVPQQTNQQQGFVCCPVTSRAEAEAYRVEAFGPPVLLVDLGHGVIYYKKFNTNTALADFAEFKFTPDSQQNQTQPAAPQIDIAGIIGAVSGRFDTIDKKMDALMERFETKPVQRPATKKGATEE